MSSELTSPSDGRHRWPRRTLHIECRDPRSVSGVLSPGSWCNTTACSFRLRRPLRGTPRHVIGPHQPEVGSLWCWYGRGEDGMQTVLDEQHDLLAAHLRLHDPLQTDFLEQT